MAQSLSPGHTIELPDIAPDVPNFNDVPVEEVFDWPDILSRVNEGYGWSSQERYIGYLVVFRSIRAEGADSNILQDFDDRAYEEAKGSDGLLLYHKGELDEVGGCVSFCLWRSREDARRATGGAAHKAAAGLVGMMYRTYRLDRRVIAWQDDRVEFSLPDNAAHE